VSQGIRSAVPEIVECRADFVGYCAEFVECCADFVECSADLVECCADFVQCARISFSVRGFRSVLGGFRSVCADFVQCARIWFSVDWNSFSVGDYTHSFV
jgi:hypothetical protein